MEITEEKQYTRTVVKATVCDMCKTEYKDITDRHPDVDYDALLGYDHGNVEDSITIEREIRSWSSYPEGGGDNTFQEIHICPKCWTDRMLPWLKSQGVNINEKRTDY